MRSGLIGLLAVAGLLIAGALGAALLIAFHRDLEIHRQRVATGSRIVTTRCGPVELAETGIGPPLLLVHGTGGGYDQGLNAGTDLAVPGLRVIAPSRFGYLRTPYPQDASAEAQADQFACLLDSLGISSIAVLGISRWSCST